MNALVFHGPQLIGGELIEPLGVQNADIAWRFSEEETLGIRSQSTSLSRLNLVVRANEDRMQVTLVNDNSVSMEFADWRFIPLDNGRCHLVNEAFGNELVLSAVNPVASGVNIVRYTVEMTGIDDALAQEWSVVKFGNPTGQFEPPCIEE